MVSATKTVLNSFQDQAIDIVPYDDIREEITDLFAV
jgi:hypothetical protein